MFEQGVSARKFATTKVDVFEQNVDDELIEQYQRGREGAHTKKEVLA